MNLEIESLSDLKDFPEVKNFLIKFFASINPNDFYYFVFKFFIRRFHNYVPVYLKFEFEQSLPSNISIKTIDNFEYGNLTNLTNADIEQKFEGFISTKIRGYINNNAELLYKPNQKINNCRKKLHGIEFGDNVSTKVQTEILKQIKKQYQIDFCEVSETFDVEVVYDTYYMTYNLNRPVRVKLSFELAEKKNILQFVWKKSSKCYTASFDSGIKLKSLGCVTVDPEAAKTLKQYGKEVDGSYGNPKIARRMKKYLNL